jgi:sulfate transport system ATP-binding protein
MRIELQNLTKKFGSFLALDDVSLTVESGELLALLGPSGCGKTTLLRILSGLEFADSGHVLFDGEDATSQSVRARRVGFVFQHYALFRHMTVFENIAFGLRVRRTGRPSRRGIHSARGRIIETGQTGEPGETVSRAAFRWATAARGAGARAGG